MSKKLSFILLALLLITVPKSDMIKANENVNSIIKDGDITYHQFKEIVVENFLYTYDLAKHRQSIQESEDIYEKTSFEELEKQIKIAEDRLDSITGKENELQIIECLNMQIDLTRAISYLILK